MKLKCSHGRRVMVLPNAKAIHRADGTECRSTITMGDKIINRARITETKIVFANPEPDDSILLTRRPVEDVSPE